MLSVSEPRLSSLVEDVLDALHADELMVVSQQPNRYAIASASVGTVDSNVNRVEVRAFFVFAATL